MIDDKEVVGLSTEFRACLIAFCRKWLLLFWYTLPYRAPFRKVSAVSEEPNPLLAMFLWPACIFFPFLEA